MEFTQFVRRPFVVDAVQITEENMEEVAKLIGDVRTKDGSKHIALDRRLVPNVPRAYVGWWMTMLGDNYRCYSPKVFKAEFIEHEPEIKFVFDDDVPADEDAPAEA